MMIAVCGQNGALFVLEQQKAVKVGFEHADRSALVAEHSEKMVRKSYELWGMLIQKIPYAPIMRMIVSAGSPQEQGGRALVNTMKRVQGQRKQNSVGIGVM